MNIFEMKVSIDPAVNVATEIERRHRADSGRTERRRGVEYAGRCSWVVEDSEVHRGERLSLGNAVGGRVATGAYEPTRVQATIQLALTMPRDGAIIFRDLVGKLEVRQVRP